MSPSVPPLGSAGPEPVLLFDAACGLCQRLVRVLLRLDRSGRLRFAPLQGTAGQAYLRRHGLPTADFDTLIFVPEWRRREQPEFLVRTAGLVAALRSTGRGGLRGAAALLAAVPPAWRDAAYKLVARWRFRLFGAWRERPLGRPEWAERFIP